jgi:hypothetical protein
MYNFFSMKLTLAAVALFSMAGMAWAAPDELDDSYAKLKAAVDKKDADAIKGVEPEVLKGAKALIDAPKPAGADEAKDWEERVKYGHEVELYCEYSLASTAQQAGDAAKTVELGDLLLAQNPKSKYDDEIFANSYLVALGKAGGSAKAVAGMQKIAAARPDNLVALMFLVERSSGAGQLNYANKLVAASKKARPEDFPEAEWEKTKSKAEGDGYYYAGIVHGQQRAYLDCDRDLTAAVPLLAGDPTRLGVAYYELGFCKYSFGKETNDRSKMVAGQQLVEKSAGMKSPMQNQAYHDNLLMKQELGGRR